MMNDAKLLLKFLFLIVLIQFAKGSLDSPGYFNNHFSLRTYGNNSKPIENTCIAYYKNLAQVSSSFIQCVANNSRPFRVCQNCLMYYLQFNEAYTLIKDVKTCFYININFNTSV